MDGNVLLYLLPMFAMVSCGLVLAWELAEWLRGTYPWIRKMERRWREFRGKRQIRGRRQ